MDNVQPKFMASRRREVIALGLVVFAVVRASLSAAAIDEANRSARVGATSVEQIISVVIQHYRTIPRMCESVTGEDRRFLGSRASVQAELRFLGPAKFFVSLTDNFAGHKEVAQFLAHDGSFTEWNLRGGLKQRDNLGLLESALFGASVGGFGYAGSWTTALLLSRVTGRNRIYGLHSNAQRLADMDLDGATMFVLKGFSPGDQVTTFWIDKKTLLIKQVEVQDKSNHTLLHFARCSDDKVYVPTELPYNLK